jgi:hypothetical protein
MTDLLSAIGERLTERWVAATLLPGLFFAAAVDLAVLLGRRHATDVAFAIAEGNRQWQRIEAGQPASYAIALLLLALTAGTAGLDIDSAVTGPTSSHTATIGTAASAITVPTRARA